MAVPLELDTAAALEMLAEIPTVTHGRDGQTWAVNPEPELYQRIVQGLRVAIPSYEHLVFSWRAEDAELVEKARSEGSGVPVPDELKQSLRRSLLSLDDSRSSQLHRSAFAIGIPLILAGEEGRTSIGALVLLEENSGQLIPNEPGEETRRQLEALGRSIASRIYLHRLVERWGTIADSERDARTGHDGAAMLHEAMRGPAELLNLPACWGYLGNPQDALSLVGYVGDERYKGSEFVRAIGHRAWESQLIETGTPSASFQSDNQGLLSFLAVPLSLADNHRGVLVFGSCARDRFSKAECFFFQRIADGAVRGIVDAESLAIVRSHGAVSAMSLAVIHDLSEYANGINTILDRLRRGPTPEQIEQGYSAAVERYEQIKTMLAAVSDYSSAIQGYGIQGKAVNIADVVEQIVERERPHLEADYLDIKVVLPKKRGQLIVECYPELLDRFVCGIMRNSLASIRRRLVAGDSPERGTISVTLSTPGPKNCRISIQDNGEGLESIDNALLYRPRGTGFMLPLCRDVVERHWQGSVKVLNVDAGRGALVTVDLPLSGTL